MARDLIDARPDPRRPRSPGPSTLAPYELVLIGTLLIAFMVHMTGLLGVVTPRAVAGAMAIEYGIVAIYGVAAFNRGHLWILGAGLAWVGYLLFQCLVWHEISGFPINANAVLSYGTLLFAIVFYETRLPTQRILNIALWFSIVYLLLYVLFWRQILDRVGPLSSLYVASDGTRPPRLFLAAPFATFVFMHGLASITRRPVTSVLLLLLSGYALLLAQSRFATAILVMAVFAVVFGSIAVQFRRAANIGLAVLFVALCSFSIAGFFVPNLNPYAAISGDASGASRAIEFRDGLEATRGYLLTGFGIAGSGDDVQSYVRPLRPFFIADMGVAGLVMEFGLVFTALALVLCVRFMTVPPRRVAQMTPPFWALFYVTQVSAFSTVFTNTLLGGAGTLFGTITLALWLRGRQAGSGRILRRTLAVGRPGSVTPATATAVHTARAPSAR